MENKHIFKLNFDFQYILIQNQNKMRATQSTVLGSLNSKARLDAKLSINERVLAPQENSGLNDVARYHVGQSGSQPGKRRHGQRPASTQKSLIGTGQICTPFSSNNQLTQQLISTQREEDQNPNVETYSSQNIQFIIEPKSRDSPEPDAPTNIYIEHSCLSKYQSNFQTRFGAGSGYIDQVQSASSGPNRPQYKRISQMASKVDQQLRDGAAFSTKSSIPVSQGDLNKGLADLSWNQKKGHKHTLSFKSSQLGQAVNSSAETTEVKAVSGLAGTIVSKQQKMNNGGVYRTNNQSQTIQFGQPGRIFDRDTNLKNLNFQSPGQMLKDTKKFVQKTQEQQTIKKDGDKLIIFKSTSRTLRNQAGKWSSRNKQQEKKALKRNASTKIFQNQTIQKQRQLSGNMDEYYRYDGVRNADLQTLDVAGYGRDQRPNRNSSQLLVGRSQLYHSEQPIQRDMRPYSSKTNQSGARGAVGRVEVRADREEEAGSLLNRTQSTQYTRQEHEQRQGNRTLPAPSQDHLKRTLIQYSQQLENQISKQEFILMREHTNKDPKVLITDHQNSSPMADYRFQDQDLGNIEDMHSNATSHLGQNLHRRMRSNKEASTVSGMADEIVHVDNQNQCEFVQDQYPSLFAEHDQNLTQSLVLFQNELMQKNNNKQKARPMTAAHDRKGNKQYATLLQQDQTRVSDVFLPDEYQHNRNQPNCRRSRPQSGSQISTHFTKSSQLKNKKCQQILEIDNSQTQSIRRSQQMFLKRQSTKFNQNDNRTITDHNHFDSSSKRFSTLTTSNQIVNYITKAKHVHPTSFSHKQSLVAKKQERESRLSQVRQSRDAAESKISQKVATMNKQENASQGKMRSIRSTTSILSSSKKDGVNGRTANQARTGKRQRPQVKKALNAKKTAGHHGTLRAQTLKNVSFRLEQQASAEETRQGDVSLDHELDGGSEQNNNEDLRQETEEYQSQQSMTELQQQQQEEEQIYQSFTSATGMKSGGVKYNQRKLFRKPSRSKAITLNKSRSRDKKLKLYNDAPAFKDLQGYQLELDFNGSAQGIQQLEKQMVRQSLERERSGGASYIQRHFQIQKKTGLDIGSQARHDTASNGHIPTNRNEQSNYVNGPKIINKTEMSADGKYHILAPTISHDDGPNCKEKIYNDVRLKYGKGAPNVFGERQMLEYSEAQCAVEIPVMIEQNVKKKHVGVEVEAVDQAAPKTQEAAGAAANQGANTEQQQEFEQKSQPEASAPTAQKKAELPPKVEEWSLPAKFIIKQRDFQIGKDFKKQESLDIYISQNTADPDDKNKQMHSTIKFNVKSKDNYDKEYGTNQMFQLVFGEEHLKLLQQKNTLGKSKTKRNQMMQEPDVEYPNRIFVTIRGRTSCALDVAVQLTFQPEIIDEATLKLLEQQKKKEMLDYEYLAKIENDLATFATDNQEFMKKALGINDTNFIKENAKQAECTQDMFYKQLEYRFQNQRKEYKAIQCQSTKFQKDLEYRQQANSKMERWEQYRQVREQYKQQAVDLVKAQVRIKLWIAFVAEQKLCVTYYKNVEQRRQFNKARLAEVMLAFAFGVRFYNRFRRSYGEDHETRLTRYWKRHMTLYGNTFHQHREMKSKEILRDVLTRLIFNQAMRDKFRFFAKNATDLVSMCRRLKYLSRMRLLTLVIQFDKELSYLTWIFDKKLRAFKGPNSKGYKYQHGIFQKLQGLKDQRDAMKHEGQEGPPLRVVEYSKFTFASYMLDYTIWAYLKNAKYVADLKQKLGSPAIYSSEEFRLASQVQRNYLKRLRIRWGELWKSAECFEKTSFVDTAKLYQVDDEGYNREVLKQTKTNDDLQILLGASGPGSPLGRESKKKSPKKKKGKKGGRASKFPAVHVVKAETFDNLEKQRILVELLTASDPASGSDCKDLKPDEIQKKKALCEPYHIMGDVFPAFQMTTTRENLQRLVIKASGIGDGEEQ